jgi:Domain of unknown function (DUF4126)
MDTLALLGSALGLGLASGLSLYGTALLTGLAIRLGWVTLGPAWSGLDVLADPLVLGVAGVLFAVEFLADKVPGLDSAWDAIHTVIRPIGGALLAVRAFGELSPAMAALAFLLLGGTVLAAHSAKASVRLLVNTSPEPVSNILVSLGENALVAGAVWLALAHPWWALGLGLIALAAAVAITAWLATRAARAVRTLRHRLAQRASRPG